MTEPAVFFSASRDEVAQSIADLVAIQVRAAVPAVGIVERVRGYVDEMAATVDRCRTPGGCSTCVERQRVVMDLRSLLAGDPS